MPQSSHQGSQIAQTDPFKDAFISYGRADSKAFAAKLTERLMAQGLNVWFDFEDIPLGVDYQQEIDDGIDHSDNFLFLISPHSVNSPYCRLEIERALHHRKRIIPLLHVEEISRETWQQRNPTGTDAEWAAYQSAGKHSSFPNMHKAIAKINWVYVREDQDDFEQSLQGLLDICQRQRDYVHRHTVLLTQAQSWERNQKQAQYLLVGEGRHQAEAWLTRRFKAEQPPCLPTNLHAEFITESTKNANNLMTQVFLAYAEDDRELCDRFRYRLMQENITVWTDQTDIPSGTDFRRAIQKGIEETDKVVYLLSPHSLASKMCQLEILYAQKLNKQIIPLLVAPVDPQQIPKTQLSLQFIDFSTNTTPEQYEKGVAKLLRILQQDADYYNEAKQMLVKALKWERQNRNPSILLRGYNLRHAEAWLKVAQTHAHHRPLKLKIEFITESLRQPPAQSLDVFISYSRNDSEFARRVNDALQIQGKTTWFDQESIASGADFQQEIYRGIEASNNFLFILSPRSVRSPYCDDEVAHAAELNKRCIPVLYQPVDTQEVPSALASVQWIDFTTKEQDFLSCFSHLVRTLETDRDHVNSHTKWSQLAIAWEQKDRSPDLLLRGSELAIAQAWLQTTHDQQKQPPATGLQDQFIEASQLAMAKAEAEARHRQARLLKLQREKTAEAKARLAEQQKYSRRQQLSLVAVSVALVLATGLGIVAGISEKQARSAQREAERSERKATRKQIDADSQTAEALFASNHQLEALHQAIEAGILVSSTADADQTSASSNGSTPQTDNSSSLSLGQRPEISVIRALGSVLYSIRERNRLSDHTNLVSALVLSPDNRLLASGSWDNTVRLWHYPSGELIHTLSDPDGHQAPVYGVAFSPDGQTVASASEDNTIKLWSVDGQLLNTLRSHDKRVLAVVFSRDGNTLISASDDGTLKFWNRDGSLRGAVEAHDGYPVLDVAVSVDGRTLASAGGDSTVRLWNLSGKLLKTFLGHTQAVDGVAFSPDGTTIASASQDQTVRLWGVDGTVKNELESHQGWVDDVAFSPDGLHLASASQDSTVKVWRTGTGDLIQTLDGHENEVWAVAFSNQHELVSGAADNTVRIWALQNDLITVFDDHESYPVESVSISPDGTLMATSKHDGQIAIWAIANQTSTTTPVRTIAGHPGKIYSVNFSPDGTTLVSTSDDNTAKVWTLDGGLVWALNDHTNHVYQAAFSPDGTTLATASKDRTVKIWDLSTGALLQTLTGHQERVYAVRFSPDGQWLASTGRDTTVRLWQRQANGAFVYDADRIFQVDNDQQAWHRDLAFSPDGQTLATAGYDKKVRLWNMEGELLQTLSGHGAWVSSVRFSPTGNLLASGSGDNTINLWRLDGTRLSTLASHTDGVLDVAFHPTENQLASASVDGTAIVWTIHLELQALLKYGCDWASFYLIYNANADEGDRTLCDTFSNASK